MDGLDFAKLLRELSLSLEFPQEKIQKYIGELREKEIFKLEADRLFLLDPGRLSDIAETVN